MTAERSSIPASAILRQKFLEEGTATTKDKIDYTESGRSHAVVNRLPWILAYFEQLDDPSPRGKQSVNQTLTTLVSHYGLSSIEELRIGLEELRDQLRLELTDTDWRGYFDPESLD